MWKTSSAICAFSSVVWSMLWSTISFMIPFVISVSACCCLPIVSALTSSSILFWYKVIPMKAAEITMIVIRIRLTTLFSIPPMTRFLKVFINYSFWLITPSSICSV